MKLKSLAPLLVSLTLGACSSPPAHYLLPTPLISKHTVYEAVRQFDSVLAQLAHRTLKDKIERGGVLLDTGTGPIFYELENDVSKDNQKFDKFLNGDNSQYQTLQSHLESAVLCQIECSPHLQEVYKTQGLAISNCLHNIKNSTGDVRKKLGQHTWPAFDSLVRHNMYIRNEKELDFAKTLGNIIAFVHTHHSGSKPSKQDLKISLSRLEVVVATDSSRQYTIYLATKGNIITLTQGAPQLYAFTPR